jgi:DNA-binding IclR family transcriptional regulator
MNRKRPSETLSTIERGFEVARALRELGGARVTELAEELDMAPSTAHKYLSTLAKERFVVKEGDVYHVGLEFLDLGTYAKNRKKGYRLSIPKVREISEETGERAQFVVEEYGRGIYLHTEASDARAVLTDRHAGIRRYLHSSAAGKAILANLPDHRIDEIIDEHGLPAETEHTITDREHLLDELDQIRESNVAYNNEESVEGLRAVGVPVRGADGFVLGSLSVSGPSNRLKGPLYREEIPDLLLGHANEIELNIRYS